MLSKKSFQLSKVLSISLPRLVSESVTLTFIPPDRRMDITEAQSQSLVYRRRRHISRAVRTSAMPGSAVALHLH